MKLRMKILILAALLVLVAMEVMVWLNAMVDMKYLVEPFLLYGNDGWYEPVATIVESLACCMWLNLAVAAALFACMWRKFSE